MIRSEMLTKACGLAVVLALAAAAPVAGAVKPPRNGLYRGSPGKIELYVSGRSIDIAAFSFKCGATTGRMSLNDIRLRRTRKGYSFRLSAHGTISFEDGSSDENGEARIRGRFSRTGRSARGTFRVSSPRCRTGDVRWRATRA
jgi:hypothetical protein